MKVGYVVQFRTQSHLHIGRIVDFTESRVAVMVWPDRSIHYINKENLTVTHESPDDLRAQDAHIITNHTHEEIGKLPTPAIQQWIRHLCAARNRYTNVHADSVLRMRSHMRDWLHQE